MTRTNIFLAVAGLLLLVVTVLGFVWLWSLSGAQDSEAARANVVARLMQRKAAAAEQIASGLARRDFARAERGAAELRRIGEASNWYVPDERYRQGSDAFRQTLDRLTDALAAQDAEGSQSAYVAMMASCAACHQQASAPPADGRGLPAE